MTISKEEEVNLTNALLGIKSVTMNTPIFIRRKYEINHLYAELRYRASRAANIRPKQLPDRFVGLEWEITAESEYMCFANVTDGIVRDCRFSYVRTPVQNSTFMAGAYGVMSRSIASLVISVSFYVCQEEIYIKDYCTHLSVGDIIAVVTSCISGAESYQFRGISIKSSYRMHPERNEIEPVSILNDDLLTLFIPEKKHKKLMTELTNVFQQIRKK